MRWDLNLLGIKSVSGILNAISSLLVGVLILLAGCSSSQEPNKLTEQTFNADSLAPFVEPDFPFITTSVDARSLGKGFPNDNITTRCLAMRLGDQAYACFDTDLLRWSVAWTGDFLSMVTMAQVSYRDFHNKNNEFPTVLGSPQLATGLYPGWSPGEPQFSDPRPPSPGPDVPSWGPLPTDIGQWGGVYLQDDEVVLSYTVNGSQIYEKPGILRSGSLTAFKRTFRIDETEQQLSLTATERTDAANSEQSGNMALFYHGTNEDSVTAITVANAPEGVEVAIQENQYGTVAIMPGSERREFTLATWSGPANSLDQFKEMISGIEPSIPDFRDGTEPYWEQTVHTKGKVAPDTAAFVSDKLVLPIPNPWKRNVRAVDIDFFDGDRAAVVTYEGDVWILEGIDDQLNDLEWTRYASGLYEPQSIAVVDDQIYTFGREGIVKPHDLNGDGVADFYENFSNQMTQSMETREWPGSMVPAPGGGFYISKGTAGSFGPQVAPLMVKGFRYGSRHSGSVLKISADGDSLQQIATGFRMPYLGIHPETGVLTASDQQGNFVPSSPVHLVDEGDYFGVPASAHRDPVPEEITPPLLWLPHNVDPSGAGQVWITGDQMGPLSGKLVHLSYGRPGLFQVLFDSTDSAVQGAASLIPAQYTAPTMKGAVNPGDGQLYITGFSLWGVQTQEISALLRIRHTGRESYLPQDFEVRRGGVMVRFNHKLNPEVATNPGNYQVKRWDYKRTENYGSGHYKLNGEPGEELLPVFSAHLSEDGRGIFLAIPDIKQAMQMQLNYNLETAAGSTFTDQLWMSAHDVAEPELTESGFPDLDIDELLVAGTGTAVSPDEPEREVSAQWGRELFHKTGCVGCHSIDGNEAGYYGPTMQGLFGSKREFQEASSTVANESYLRQSILEPEARVVKDFGEEMPSFVGILSDKEIESIVMYIKSLSGSEQASN